MTEDHFRQILQTELAGFPAEYSNEIENVEICIEDTHEKDHRVLALYEGVPLTRRTPGNYFGVMPDRITFYKETICSTCESEAEVKVAVHHVLRHEVAHYFGISDDRLREMGKY